jgi:hypothetical protein
MILSAVYKDSAAPVMLGCDSWAEGLEMALKDPRRLLVLRWISDHLDIPPDAWKR